MISPDKLREAAASVQKRFTSAPRVALILGSGLGDFADELHSPITVSSAEIPHYPSSSVPGHEGKLVFGTIRRGKRESSPLLVFKGRVHFYESGDVTSSVFPVALANALGASTLIVTNAAGGINRSFSAGDLMLITDFLSLTFLAVPIARKGNPNALSPTIESRFGGAEKSAPMNSQVTEVLRGTARDLSMELREGTYCWVQGPSYETAAEIEMLSRSGADAVGMSTVPEISYAARVGMTIGGISLISNMATGISTTRLSHQEVTETAERVKARYTKLLSEAILRL